MGRQMDSKKDRQKKQTDGIRKDRFKEWTDRWIDIQTDTDTYGQKNKQTDGRCKDGRTVKQIDRQTDRQIKYTTERQTHTHIVVDKYKERQTKQTMYFGKIQRQKKDRYKDRHTDRQINYWTDKYIVLSYIDRRTEKQINRKTDRQIHK